MRPDGPEMETSDTHFDVKCVMDIDQLPMSCHQPAHRRKLRIYSDNVGSDVELEQELSGDSGDECPPESLEPHVLATLCLNSHSFVMGQHVIADVTVENHTGTMVLCVLKFEKVWPR